MDLPKTTIVNQIIPKDRFGFPKPTTVGRLRWVAKFSGATLNLPSKNISEVELISVEMPNFDGEVLATIQEKIPHKIIFFVNDEDMAVVIDGRVFDSKIIKEIDVAVLNIDAIYETTVRRIIGIGATGGNLDQQIKDYLNQEDLRKQIGALNKKIAAEKQVNKKQELARKRFELEQQLRG